MDYNYQRRTSPGLPMATASMFLGLAAMFTTMTVFLPPLLGGLAIVTALLSKGYGRKMILQAKVGMILGIFALTVVAVIVFSILAMMISNPDLLIEIGRQYDAMYQNIYGQSFESLNGISYEDIMRQYADFFRSF